MREMNMKILTIIRDDEEIKQLRQEWKEKFTSSFPVWNYDCYGGVDDFKQRVKMALEAGKSICEICPHKKCKKF